MDIDKLKKILRSVAKGRTSPDDAASELSRFSIEDIEYAHIDHHRSLRKGFPEVIFGEGKTAGQIIGIMEKMIAQETVILVTRVAPGKARKVLATIPEAVYHGDAKMVIWKKGGNCKPIRNRGKGVILIMCAGTSDIPVAKEAALTAEAMGNRVESVFDVGVAGLHRLFAHKALIEQATVLVVAAGMEGALPSVVAGMVAKPVIAVPTSVGYGSSFNGLTALFSMLNSCSSNVAVVNIDNGFGAGYMASMINRV